MFLNNGQFIKGNFVLICVRDKIRLKETIFVR